MNDKDFIDSYKRNENHLKKFTNYRPMFAFPFGQPNTCYSNNQIKLLLEQGCKIVFNSYPSINYTIENSFFYRIPLYSFHNSDSKIWFQLFSAIKNNIRSRPTFKK